MDIDFVVLWVDGEDQLWRRDMESFRACAIAEGSLSELFPEASNDIRYRELGTLRYLLRSIEHFCPWYRYLHLVVEGHVPAWLNLLHPKLRIVRHRDIFPDPSQLPTFNTNAIHMHLHRIPDLADQFVLCDDDFLVMKPLPTEAFFCGGLPRDFFILESKRKSRFVWDSTFEATISELNRELPLIRNFRHLFNHGQTKSQAAVNLYHLLRTGFRLSRFRWSHFCQPYLKATLEECWRIFPEAMQKTSSARFRQPDDMSQYLFRGFQLLTGKFVPCAEPRGLMVSLGNDFAINQERISNLLGTNAEFGCITEAINLDMQKYQQALVAFLDHWLIRRFPDASEFEKKTSAI